MKPSDDPIELKSPAGPVLIDRATSRILFAGVDGQNALWLNDAFDGGWNLGGDRLWIGPERIFFRPRDKAGRTRWRIPRAIDPGEWRLERSGASACAFSMDVDLGIPGTSRRLQATVTRQIRVDPPVDPAFLPGATAYTITHGLQLHDGPGDCPCDLWTVTQVPTGGVVTVGRALGAGEVTWHSRLRPGIVVSTDRAWRIGIERGRRFKIGFDAASTSGRLVYDRPVDGGRLVLWRDIAPRPWLMHADSPAWAPTRPGGAIQVYNDDGSEGDYAELEHHSPAARMSSGGLVSDTFTTVIGLVGRRDWPTWSRRWLGRDGHGARG